MNYGLKKIICIWIVMLILLPCTVTCLAASTSDISRSDGICVYSWNDEVQQRIEDHFLKRYPEYKNRIKFVMYSTADDSYFKNVMEAINNPKNNTAIVAMQASEIQDFVDTGSFVSMNSIGITEEDYAEAYTCTVKAGTCNGNVMALTFQTTPRDFIYDAAIAEKVLGSSDPVIVQSMINTPEKFIEVASRMKAAGYYMTSGADAILSFCTYPEVSEKQIENMKYLHNQLVNMKYDTGNECWSNMWESDMVSGKVFGWFGCGWFDRYSFNSDKIKEMSVCEGPIPGIWGGTYLGVTNAGKQTEIVEKILKTICCDEDVAYEIQQEDMNFSNNRAAIKRAMQRDEKYEYKDGQNPLEIWDRVALCTGVDCPHPKTYNVGAIAATCIDDGYTGDEKCLMCDELILPGMPVKKTDVHQYDNGSIIKQPTCISTGEMLYVCKLCGKTKKEYIIETGDHVSDAGIIIKNSTCTEKGIVVYHCTICKKEMKRKELPLKDHQWDDGVVTKNATTSECGNIKYKCRVCEAEYDESVPKLPLQKQYIKVASKVSKTVKMDVSKLQKNKKSFLIKARAKGKITYTVNKGNKKYISVSKKGKVTLKKGCKKGTYKIKITAAKTNKYDKAVKIITIKVK